MLIREIEDLKAALVRIDKGNIQSTKSIARNKERISSILHKMSDNKLDIRTHIQPIHCLLSVGPLARCA